MAASLLQLDADSRERIPGSPLVPGGVCWSDDGRLAVVSDMSVLISTFRSHELEMFQPQGPAVSKDFVFLPESTSAEHIPVAIPQVEALGDGLPGDGATYFLLNEADRHQNNPKELSLSKNAGKSFVQVVWGPRGSAPNASCALLALTASSRVSLHFPPSFHMSWKEAAVFSETLFSFLQSKSFQLSEARSTHVGAEETKSKKRKLDAAQRAARDSISEYSHQCAMMSTLSMAWSPFMVTKDKQHTTSLLALSGRKVSTIWAYAYPTFVSDAPAQQLLSQAPVAWIDTERHGWVATSTWQQMHRHGTAYPTQEQLTLVLGTSEGNVLLASVPVLPAAPDGQPLPTALDRVIVTPNAQPVFGLCLGNRWTYSNSRTNDLLVASGSTISVWDAKKKKELKPRAKWKAHDGNVTGLATNYFGDVVFSAAVDGVIKMWEKHSGKELFSSDARPESSAENAEASAESSDGSKNPIFGLAVSPSSAQLASVFIIPPASRPNRKSQADVSYSRVSCSLEYIPAPWVKDSQQFVDVVCRMLDESQSVDNFIDVVWFCYNDNAAVLSLQGSTEFAIPSLLSKINGESSNAPSTNVLSRQPVYLNLCDELEKRYGESKSSDAAAVPLFLQAALLLRSAITPADHQVAAQTAALAKIRRALGVYWAERCLTLLIAEAKKAGKPLGGYIDGSLSEKSSALAMADFLSVQYPLTPRSQEIVTQVYGQLDTAENISEWSAFIQAKASASGQDEEDSDAVVVRVPPPRETCFICEKAVPFGELEITCVDGHTLERCFLSFRCISAMEVWKCMGCGASAGEIDLSSGTSPFYLLDTEVPREAPASPTTAEMQIMCRLCGSHCSFSKY